MKLSIVGIIAVCKHVFFFIVWFSSLSMFGEVLTKFLGESGGLSTITISWVKRNSNALGLARENVA